MVGVTEPGVPFARLQVAVMDRKCKLLFVHVGESNFGTPVSA